MSVIWRQSELTFLIMHFSQLAEKKRNIKHASSNLSFLINSHFIFQLFLVKKNFFQESMFLLSGENCNKFRNFGKLLSTRNFLSKGNKQKRIFLKSVSDRLN